MTQGFRGSHKLEGASDHWPSAPCVRYAAGGTASRFLAVRGTYSAREGHPSAPSQVHVSHKPSEKGKSVPTYANTNQDHLDVTEHLRDSNDHVEYDRHELRETRHP